MKFEIRTPSVSKSISARTKGRITRSAKSAFIPGYGQRGTGIVKNPSRALYNRVYNKTTVGINDSFSSSKKTRSSQRSKSHTYESTYVDCFDDNSAVSSSCYLKRNYEISYDLPFAISSSTLALIQEIEQRETQSQRNKAIEEARLKIKDTEEFLSDFDSRNILTIIRNAPSKVLILSIETTGSSKLSEEMLSLIVETSDGTRLFDHLFKPPTRKRWQKTLCQHGIHWQDVKNQPEASNYRKEIQSLLSGSKAIVFSDISRLAVFVSTFPSVLPSVPLVFVEDEYQKLGQKEKAATEELDLLPKMAINLNIKDWQYGTSSSNADTLYKISRKLFSSKKYCSAIKQDRELFEWSLSYEKSNLKRFESQHDLSTEDVKPIFEQEFDRAIKEAEEQAEAMRLDSSKDLIPGIICSGIGFLAYLFSHFVIGTIIVVLGFIFIMSGYSTYHECQLSLNKATSYKQEKNKYLSSITVKKI